MPNDQNILTSTDNRQPSASYPAATQRSLKLSITAVNTRHHETSHPPPISHPLPPHRPTASRARRCLSLPPLLCDTVPEAVHLGEEHLEGSDVSLDWQWVRSLQLNAQRLEQLVVKPPDAVSASGSQARPVCHAQGDAGQQGLGERDTSHEGQGQILGPELPYKERGIRLSINVLHVLVSSTFVCELTHAQIYHSSFSTLNHTVCIDCIPPPPPKKKHTHTHTGCNEIIRT